MPGVASDGGRDLCVSLDSYHPPQAGQPPVSKVLSCHGLLSSLGAWRLGEHLTSRLSTTAPGNNKRKMSKKRPALKLGCWNVWTMMPSLSQDLQGISDARKTAVINDELKRLNVDISTLQETWLANAGTLKERDYTFFWQGKSSNEPRENGVGFAVKNSLLSMVEPGSSGSKWLLNLCLNTTEGPVTLISVYTTMLSATLDAKDEFYKNLASTTRSIPSTEQLVLLGDFNGREGADNDSWPSCLGPFGVGKMNENGQWLLKLCVFHNLCITNSFFKTKPQHKVSWRHPHSKHWHQLDLILVRHAAIKNVHTCSYHSMDCDTDHSLVCCKIRLQPKKFHRAKKLGNPRIDVSKMTQPDLIEQFAEAFEEEYDASQSGDTATEKWETLQDTIHHIALAIFGKKTSKLHDWYEAKSSEMTPVIEAKQAALAKYKQSPTKQNLQTLRAARSKVQCIVRCCAKEYWTEHSEMIKMAAVMSNIRGMYDGIKKVLGPMQSKMAPLKTATGEVITDQGRQMERWVEHYSDLYSRENTVTPSALGTIKCMPIMEELDVEPTMDKLSKVIDSLAAGKAPGSNSIPPDLIKHCKTTLLHPLHEVLCQCWREGAVLQDMRDAKIITLYKNKGKRSDCNNYRGISLLSIIGKVYAQVLLIHLQRLAEHVYPESQCDFWAERSTVDMVFSLHQLQEKCREPLYIAFIDLTKAFNLVSRDCLFKALCKISCPPRLHSLIESFHSNMKGTVQFNSNLSEPFNMCSRVKQGCILAPALFGIFFALLLRHAFGTAQEGIYLQTRSDGSLFNLAHLKARTKVHEALIRDMLFADDTTVMTHTQRELQLLMDCFSQACKDFGLIISPKKTNALGQDILAPPVITINDYGLEVIHQFMYLGSTITNNLSLDSEIDKRIGKAATTLTHLTSRVWTNPKLTVKMKMAVYNACILSTLLYGSETWTTYAHQEIRLNTFHLRSLWHILSISWQDKVTNTDVLSHAGLSTMYTLLRQCRLCWLGHVCHMEDGQILKDILYRELTSGQRSTGCPQLRYKDACKRDMKVLDININYWEDLAANHTSWRSTLHKQLQSSEKKLTVAAAEKQACKKEMAANRPESMHRCNLSHWSLQPQEALLKLSRQPGQVMDGLSSSMVSHDRRRPTLTPHRLKWGRGLFRTYFFAKNWMKCPDLLRKPIFHQTPNLMGVVLGLIYKKKIFFIGIAWNVQNCT